MQLNYLRHGLPTNATTENGKSGPRAVHELNFPYQIGGIQELPVRADQPWSQVSHAPFPAQG